MQHSPIVLTHAEYLDAAEALLNRVETLCDDLAQNSTDDIDTQRVGAMLTLTLANRSQIVVNMQKPLQEIWLATKIAGYHFGYDGAHWQDTKGQGEFFSLLEGAIAQQARS